MILVDLFATLAESENVVRCFFIFVNQVIYAY